MTLIFNKVVRGITPHHLSLLDKVTLHFSYYLLKDLEKKRKCITFVTEYPFRLDYYY